MRTLCVIVALLASASALRAQMLAGPWVDEAQKRIEQHRTAWLRVIVLDLEGRPAPASAVKITMLEHAFPWGFVLEPNVRPRLDAEVYRCFNTVSLRRITNWKDKPPDVKHRDFEAVDEALWWAKDRGIRRVHWGPLLDFDAARTPPWIAGLDASQEWELIERYVAQVLNEFIGVSSVEITASANDRAYLRERFGDAGLRRLHELARVRPPVAAGFDQSLAGPSLQNLVTEASAMREQLVPLDQLSVTQRYTGVLVQPPLQRAMDWVQPMQTPIFVSGVEVGGPSAQGAALNLELVLRVLFSSAQVTGIVFEGVGPTGVSDPTAALLDERGAPTAAGLVLERMIRGLWWTATELRADELGNVRTRVMAGRHELSATLADGTVARLVVSIAAGQERTVMLQPLRSSR